MPQQFLLFLTLLLIISLKHCCVSFVFMPSHLLFLLLFLFFRNSETLFSTHFSLSVTQGTFYDQPPAPPARTRAFTSIVHSLTLPNLELTFLAHMICDHAVIYKVSSAPLPQLSFFSFFLDVCRLSLGNKGCRWLLCRGSVYPVAQL